MTKQTDWEAIEREYRAGQLSVSEIGRQYSVSHTAINKKAKAQGWTRNLAARVKQVVSAHLVSDGVSISNARETIELAAARAVDVVRSHRRDISRGRDVVARLIEELDFATAKREEIAAEIEAFTEVESETSEAAKTRAEKRRSAMHRAVSLSARAGAMQSLAGALKTVVQLERQAFSIESDPGDDEAPAPVTVTIQDASVPDADAQ